MRDVRYLATKLHGMSDSRHMDDTILGRWNIDAEQLTEIIDSNPSLRGMLFGYVAERKLHDRLRSHPMVSALEKDDDHDRRKKGDHRLTYRGEEFTIETKSLQTNSIKSLEDGRLTGQAQCDASDRRRVIFPDDTTLETTLLMVDEFDVLAVNLFAFTGRWTFVFALNRDLPRSRYSKYTPIQQNNLLASLVTVEWPLPENGIFTEDLFSLLDCLVEERSHSKLSSLTSGTLESTSDSSEHELGALAG